MNTAQVDALRALLASTGWLDRTRRFAVALRRRSRTPQGLLVVGTPADEPWHMTAHIADESELAGVPGADADARQVGAAARGAAASAVGLERLERAGRSETLLVVSGGCRARDTPRPGQPMRGRRGPRSSPSIRVTRT